MELVNANFQMVQNIMVNFLKVKCMEEEFSNGHRDQESNQKYMMENINIVISMDLENLPLDLEIFMKGIGNKVKDMDKE